MSDLQDHEDQGFSREEDVPFSGPSIDSMVVRRTPGLPTDGIVEKILLVADAMSGSRLYPYQREFGGRIIEAILEREQEELTALFARQSGKSQTLSAIAGAMMVVLPALAVQFPDDDRFRFYDPKSDSFRSYEDGFWVGIFAPKRGQAAIIFNRIRKFYMSETSKAIFDEAGITFDTNNGDTVRLSNGSFIACSTASDQSHIEGLTLHLGIIEEAQDISDEKATKSIGPMMAATGGTIVKIGTANARKSHFYNSIRNNIRRENQGAAKNHFFVSWVVAAKYNTPYERFVRKEMMRLGERSDEFRMAYDCVFMLARGLAVSESLFLNRTVTDGHFSDFMPGPRPGMHYVAGIDFGKIHDSTVVTVLEVDWDNPRNVLEAYDPDEGEITVEIFGKHVVDILELLGDDYEAQFVQIKEFLRKWRPERMALDYTGVGIPLGDKARAQFNYADIDFVSYSPQSKDELGRQLLADIHSGMITWPGGETCVVRDEYKQFKAQMLDLEKEYKYGGLLDLHHPDVRGAHDDYPQSLMLSIHAANSRPFGGEVEELHHNLRAG